ncbi:MAG TPA: hypothetical protein VNQ90_05375 [Chthoniobacteraceae bacterium]|nr:hypothetical protein [Chthoniobacteraceae bacterium]
MLHKYFGLIENASEHGFQIDQMMEFVHWVMGILFVGWSIFFLITIFKFRKSRNPKADYHGVKSKASTHIELMVVLVESIFLLGFGIPIWAKRVNGVPPDSDYMRIRVIAQQFLWNFHYPGPDGIFGPQKVSLVSATNPLGLDLSDPTAQDDLVVINEAHIPLNKNVIIDISSKDVIHSFALKHMRVGQDAIPGMATPVWFKPIKTGSFELVCGQLCGTSHYAMRGFVVVDTDEDYQEWEKEMQALKAPPPTAAAPAKTDAATAATADLAAGR